MHIEDMHKRKDGTLKPTHGKGKRWRVVYTEGAARRSRSFRTQDEARAFMVATEHKQRSGEYVPTRNRKALVSDLLPAWEASLIRLKPSTLREVQYTINDRLIPKWGHQQVGAITRQDVQAWVYELHNSGLAPRTVDTTYGRLRAFYGWCVNEGHAPATPCRNITLPRGHSRERIYLTPDEVRSLLEHVHPHHRLLVEMLVTTGLRFGEASELRVKDLDLPRRRAAVDRSYTRGTVTLPKTHRRRTVPLTASLVDGLAERTEGKVRNALVFTNESGTRLDVNNWRKRIFTPAAREAGLPDGLRVHDLRHAAAALLIRSGASVKALQTMLGHADAKITLMTYSSMYSDELDDLSERMSEMLDDSS